MPACRDVIVARPSVILTAAGCSVRPLLSQGPGVGSLKTSLSHMEFENQQLRRKVSALGLGNRQYENQLLQVESHNGELLGQARRREVPAQKPGDRRRGNGRPRYGRVGETCAGSRRPVRPQETKAAVRPDPRPDRHTAPRRRRSRAPRVGDVRPEPGKTPALKLVRTTRRSGSPSPVVRRLRQPLYADPTKRWRSRRFFPGYAQDDLGRVTIRVNALTLFPGLRLGGVCGSWRPQTPLGHSEGFDAVGTGDAGVDFEV